jgi:D-alanine--D-alanine ligase
MLEMLNKPYVGAGVLGSAVGMDKEVMKKLFVIAGIPHTYNLNGSPVSYPIFVKPASMGSSVGVSKVNNKEELDKAIEKAFRFDTKIIMEEMVEGREIEVAVMGNEKLEVSLPGEIVPKDKFYSYEEKYDENQKIKLKMDAYSYFKEKSSKKTDIDLDEFANTLFPEDSEKLRNHLSREGYEINSSFRCDMSIFKDYQYIYFNGKDLNFRFHRSLISDQKITYDKDNKTLTINNLDSSVIKQIEQIDSHTMSRI